jgi:acyl-CoA thioesterase
VSDSEGEGALAARVARAMMTNDPWSQLLGITLVETGPERCICRMTVRPDMLNGFGVTHGGVAYSLADSAFAFACNSHGRVTVSIENSITYPAPVHPGDILTAEACMEAESNRLGYYRVNVTNQRGVIVALFRGTAYKTQKPHFPDEATS